MAQAEKIRLDIPVLLPGVDDARDRCVERLIASLTGRDGISEVHVAEDAASHAPQLCIHYEPRTIALQRVRELAASSGAALGERFAHLAFRTSTQHARAARRLTDQVSAFPGVIEAEVATTGSVRIEFDRTLTDEQRVRSELEKLGLNLESVKPGLASGGHHTHAHEGHEGVGADRKLTHL